MKHKPKSRAQIIQEFADFRKNIGIIVGGRVGLLVTLVILIDVWGFDKEDVHVFKERYLDLMESYNQGNEDPEKWIDALKDDYDLDILGEFNAMK